MEAITTLAGHLIAHTGKIIGQLLQREFTAHKKSMKQSTTGHQFTRDQYVKVCWSMPDIWTWSGLTGTSHIKCLTVKSTVFEETTKTIN